MLSSGIGSEAKIIQALHYLRRGDGPNRRERMELQGVEVVLGLYHSLSVDLLESEDVSCTG